MRKLNEIAGFAIMLFLISAMSYYTGDLSRLFIALGTVLIAVSLIVIKLVPNKKKKRRGYLKG